MTTLEVRNCTIALDRRTVVRQTNCVFRPGELVGLLGPNGVGKTTLLRAAAGLIPVKAGKVLLDGQDIHTVPGAEKARRIAYMPQGAECHWPLTVEYVVALGRLPRQAPWADLGRADIDRITACLHYTDTAYLAGRPVTELSGGERTRVMLARALAGEPEILLADEPVAGLDPAHQIDVMALLKNLARDGEEKGAGIVVVLHDLTLAARYCDRVVLMSQGRILADAPPGEALSPANLADCYGIRVFAGQAGDGVFVVPTERIGDSA